jgi:hypothetical protein
LGFSAALLATGAAALSGFASTAAPLELLKVAVWENLQLAAFLQPAADAKKAHGFSASGLPSSLLYRTYLFLSAADIFGRDNGDKLK